MNDCPSASRSKNFSRSVNSTNASMFGAAKSPWRISSRPSAASVSAADIGDDRRNAWSWLIASMRGVAAIASGEIGLKMLSNSTPPTRFADSYSTWSSWRCTPNISCS